MKISGVALPDLHIQVLYFGSRSMRPAVRRRTAPTPCWILHWNQTRTATLRFNGRLWRLGPDSISLTAPRTVVDETMEDGEEHTYLHFMLGPSYDRIESRVLVLPAAGDLRRLLKALSDSYRQKDRLDHVDEFGVHALVCLVLRAVPESFWPAPPEDPRIVAALRVLDERFGEKIANPSLAKEANLATSSFLRLFRYQAGESPQRYLMRRRLEQAALLLAQTDRSIDDIAASCGFCDRNHFSVHFKHVYLVGPATYRRERILR